MWLPYFPTQFKGTYRLVALGLYRPHIPLIKNMNHFMKTVQTGFFGLIAWERIWITIHAAVTWLSAKDCCRFTGRSDHRVWTGGGLWLPCSVQEPGIAWISSGGGWWLYYNPQPPCVPPSAIPRYWNHVIAIFRQYANVISDAYSQPLRLHLHY